MLPWVKSHTVRGEENEETFNARPLIIVLLFVSLSCSAGAQKREPDLFETDLREATVVTLYLLTNLNVKLRPKLLSELEIQEAVK